MYGKLRYKNRQGVWLVLSVRAVDSDNPRFESSHRLNLYWTFSSVLKRQKWSKKRPRMVAFLIDIKINYEKTNRTKERELKLFLLIHSFANEFLVCRWRQSKFCSDRINQEALFEYFFLFVCFIAMVNATCAKSIWFK